VQKLCIFLQCLKGNSNRVLQEQYQHAGSTISTIVQEVATVVLRMKSAVITLPGPELPKEISDKPKFFPYFKDCIGAIDGTHIMAVVAPAEERAYRNRKGFLSQNVLACCKFNLQFCFVLAGWEGSAHDGRVLADAIEKGFATPTGKYYLGDAGYGLSTTVLTPYRGVRYHLKEWMNNNQRPQNAKELYNLRHASLRNVVERIFGVVKHRFPMLVNMHSFSFSFQCDIILCCCIIHNFIWQYQEDEDTFDVTIDLDADVIQTQEIAYVTTETQAEAELLRSSIAQQMWDDYLVYIDENNLN
jgi:hypothetical protein